MNRIRLLAIGGVMVVALTAAAQQGVTKPSVPGADDQLAFLTAKLGLSVAQQDKIKPALQQLHDVSVQLVDDSSLSREDRLDKVRPYRMAVDKKLRAVLTDDQKQKLDQLEQEPHPELHGAIN
jgi:hypothetical protein